MQKHPTQKSAHPACDKQAKGFHQSSEHREERQQQITYGACKTFPHLRHPLSSDPGSAAGHLYPVATLQMPGLLKPAACEGVLSGTARRLLQTKACCDQRVSQVQRKTRCSVVIALQFPCRVCTETQVSCLSNM